MLSKRCLEQNGGQDKSSQVKRRLLGFVLRDHLAGVLDAGSAWAPLARRVAASASAHSAAQSKSSVNEQSDDRDLKSALKRILRFEPVLRDPSLLRSVNLPQKLREPRPLPDGSRPLLMAEFWATVVPEAPESHVDYDHRETHFVREELEVLCEFLVGIPLTIEHITNARGMYTGYVDSAWMNGNSLEAHALVYYYPDLNESRLFALNLSEPRRLCNSVSLHHMFVPLGLLGADVRYGIELSAVAKPLRRGADIYRKRLHLQSMVPEGAELPYDVYWPHLRVGPNKDIAFPRPF
jgi:hypothetical protein